jgi:uncharacterized protein (DUF1684 family)
MTPEEHRESVLAWRAERDARLRDPDGWLTLVGLHWLAPGENRFGADPTNDFVLAGAQVPAVAGSLVLDGGVVELHRDDHDAVRMEVDVSGEPTVLDIGSLRMYVIQRGDRFGLRVRDHASPALAAFEGMSHFEIDASWRLVARLDPAEAGTTVEIMDVIGVLTREPTPGSVVFDRDGQSWRIDTLPGGDDGSLWLVFGDATNGSTTYGGGRFVYTEPVAADGSVVVDFNLAYNPPCVFTPYATCPLPPSQNRLPLAIEAGERAYRPTLAAQPA